MPDFASVRAVILAGGSGTRLWPLSRLQAPKQFLQILGETTLLEATVNRLAPLIPKSQVVIVTNEATAIGEGYRPLEPYEKILEPAARNTAAAIGAAAIRYQVEGLDPVMVVLPSDHLILDIPAFQRALTLAIVAAEEGKLVTFGIHPTSPETGFGYIQSGAGGSLLPVVAFHEKPDRTKAEQFLASGDYHWNSGMFVWRASAILREIGSHLPALADVLSTIANESKGLPGFHAALRRHFGVAPSISIDHGVLEKSKNLFMVRGDFGWSDVGSWDAVYEVSEKDVSGNSVFGNVVAVDCSDSLIRSHDRLVAVVDVHDVSVIETSDAVLVMPRGQSQSVRKVVEALSRGRGTEHIHHLTVRRPWGSYTVLEEGPGFKIKRIEVLPGGRLSLQRHEHRSEHWVVVAGEATVTSDGAVSRLTANQSTFIPIGTMHRLENLAATPLQIIEVQVGAYVGEDDIQRFDDHYGRANEAASSK
jgi:mannose-1-phosphate guanylyltransferase/mannose-6-phosphate isomerase